jgi:hypothetical protein
MTKGRTQKLMGEASYDQPSELKRSWHNATSGRVKVRISPTLTVMAKRGEEEQTRAKYLRITDPFFNPKKVK